MQKPIEVDEVIRQYATGKLDFEPGTRWSYSNTGFLILGRVVEKVSGEPFGEFLARRILKPIGLTHTAYEPQPSGAGFAQGYASFLLSPPRRWVPKPMVGSPRRADLLHPADLAKWDLALIGGKVLNPESFKLMTTGRLLANGRPSGYGCGLMVRLENGETVLTHNGAVNGLPGAEHGSTRDPVRLDPAVEHRRSRRDQRDQYPSFAVALSKRRGGGAQDRRPPRVGGGGDVLPAAPDGDG